MNTEENRAVLRDLIMTLMGAGVSKADIQRDVDAAMKAAVPDDIWIYERLAIAVWQAMKRTSKSWVFDTEIHVPSEVEAAVNVSRGGREVAISVACAHGYLDNQRWGLWTLGKKGWEAINKEGEG